MMSDLDLVQDPLPMTIDEILEQFVSSPNGFPHEAVAAAEAQAEAITPRLLELLEAATANPDDVGEDDLRHIFAAFLLAQFREKEAYSRIVDMVTLPPDEVELLVGEGVIEDLAMWLASVAHGDLTHIDRLVRTEGADQYARGAGIHAIVIMVVQGILERSTAIDYLRGIFHDLPFSAESDMFWADLVLAAGDLSAKELEAEVMPIIEDDAFEYMSMKEPSEIVEDLESDPVAHLEKLREQPTYQLITNTSEDMMGWWRVYWEDSTEFFDFDDDPPFFPPSTDDFSFDRLPFLPSPPVEFRSEQPGRNDPCPCGSGKKYKKCHGA